MSAASRGLGWVGDAVGGAIARGMSSALMPATPIEDGRRDTIAARGELERAQRWHEWALPLGAGAGVVILIAIAASRPRARAPQPAPQTPGGTPAAT
ncbi:MAG: hypothetical protein HY744_04225 [Deltaproteobacteria bacterium]|nr:hypothetical protein [Deltaproteobacteria bacterium]